MKNSILRFPLKKMLAATLRFGVFGFVAMCFVWGGGDVFGQNGKPGGVGTNATLRLWVRADAGTNCTTDGCNITSWTDQSTAGNNGSATGGGGRNQDYRDNAMNFNPSVEVDNNGFIQFTRNIEDDMSIFVVFRTDETGGTSGGLPNWFTAPSILSNQYDMGTDDFGIGMHNGLVFWGHDNTNDRINGNAGTYNNDVPQLVSVTRNMTSGGVTIGMNGLAPVTGTGPTTTLDDIAVIRAGLSADVTGGPDEFQGHYGDIVFYNQTLNATDVEKVNSYLAIKYGITLAHNYRNPNGGPNLYTVAGFANETVGIARFDTTALHQKQSRNREDATNTTLTVYNGTHTTTFPVDNAANSDNLTEGQSLLMGHDGQAPTFTTTFSGVPNVRMDRVYKVENTQDVDSVTLVFNNSIFTGLNPGGNYYMMVSPDPTFDQTDSVYRLNEVGNGNDWYVQYDFPGSVGPVPPTTTYITLKEGPFKAPGGIGKDLQLWVKADSGLAVGGTVVWEDLSGFDRDMNYAVGASTNLVVGGVNFNDYLENNPGTYSKTFGSGASMEGRTLVVVGRSSGGANGREYAGLDGVGLENDVTGIKENGGGGESWTNPGGAASGLVQNGIDMGARAPTTEFSIITGYRNAGVTGEFFLGPYDNAGDNMNDYDFVEAIVYLDNKFNAGTLDFIETYLAIKYGITLDNNYVSSDQSTVAYDVSTYGNDIAGLGRDDYSDLDQRQSSSINNDAVVEVGHGAIFASNALNTNNIGADRSYVVWGNDDGASCWSDADLVIAAEPRQHLRLEREWKMTESGPGGFGGLVLTLDTANANFVIPEIPAGATDYILYVDDDGNFSNGGTSSFVMVWNSLTTKFEAPINPNGTTIYFTFGTRFTNPAPLQSFCAGDTAYFVGSHLNTNGRCARLQLGASVYTLDSLGVPDFQLHGFQTDENNGSCLDTTYWEVPAIPSVVTAGVYKITPEITTSSGPCGAFVAGENIRGDSIQLGSPIPTDIEFVGVPPGTDSLTLCLGDVNPEITILQGKPGIFGIGSSSTGVPINTLLNDTTVMVTSATIGDHQIIFTPQGAGCASYDSLWVSIDTLQPTNFEYGSTQVCATFGTYPVTLPPVPSLGGYETFPASTGPTIIDANTGEFFPSVADTGTYAVVYSPPRDSGCFAKDTVLLRIVGEQAAQFTYPGSPYCSNEPNPVASVQYIPPGFTGGGFRTENNAPGLTVDATTGELDLATATLGTYQIIYDLIGSCIDTPSVSVTIFGTPNLNFTIPDTVCSSRDTLTPLSPTPGMNSVYWTEWTQNVTIDSTTGFINLDSSSIGGPFPITFHATNGNNCSDSVTKPLVILGAPTTNIFYPGSTTILNVCENDPVLVPVFQGGTGGGIFTSNPATPALDSTTGVFDPSQANPGGSYGVSYESPFTACPETTFVQTIAVNPVPDAFFTMAMDTVCEGGANILVTPTGGLGTLSIFDGTTAVNAISGSSIVVANLPSNVTYEVQHIATGIPGGCQDTFVDYLVVRPREDASFTYLSDTLCDNINNPTPLILGDGGGLFLADFTVNNNTLVDSMTGVLDLDSSGIDSSCIVYQTPGVCSDIDTVCVVILNGFEAFFSYEKNNVCTNDLVLNVDSIATPGVGGTFAPDTSSLGLSVNLMTGEVDLIASNIVGEQNFNVIHTVGQSGTCVATHAVPITVTAFDSLLAIAYPQDTFCQSIDSIIPTISSGFGIPTGQFANSPGINYGNDSTGVILVSQSGTGQFVIQYELDGICGEVATTEIFISPDDDSLFAYGNNGAICYSSSDSSLFPSLSPNSTGVFSASSGQASVNLVFQDSTTGEINVAGSEPGVYQVTYNSNGICPSSYTTVLRVNDQPTVGTISVLPGTAVCDSQDVDFSLAGTPGGSVFYYLNGILQTQSSVWDFDAFQEGDSVAVVVENTFGCADTASVIMTITTKPAVRIRQRPGVLTGADPIQIEVGPNLDNTTINWSVTTGDSISVDSTRGATAELDVDEFEMLTNNILLESDFIPDSIIYYFEAESRGCSGDLDSIIIYVNPNAFPIFVPEVFTPDGNGLNDTWKIQWSSDLNEEDYIIDVYNPSGGRVYQMIGLNPDWNGENLPDGVYWWVLKNQVTSESILAGGVTIRRR